MQCHLPNWLWCVVCWMGFDRDFLKSFLMDIASGMKEIENTALFEAGGYL